MYFTPEYLAANRNLTGHWNALWANRDQFNVGQRAMVQQYRGTMTQEELAANAINGYGRDFWAELDNQVIQLRNQEIGMEIVTDLLTVQTVLDVGKTAKLYNRVGDIAEDVSISLDGQAPYSFDHTEYGSDGDPVPMLSAGYGVNWRHARGLSTVGIDLVLDSQAAKLRKFNKRIVSYMLNGDPQIQVDAYPAQGAKNHRNTRKINLGAGAGGADIDLTTASAEELLAFFGPMGPFGVNARANQVAAYDVLWVSYEIWANMSRPYLITMGADANAIIGGSVGDAIKRYIAVRDIRPTYAMVGNEFLGYVRNREVITPLIGMATSITPLPRPLPQTNYNFQILAAMGLQVKQDADGFGGVVYGAELV